jgi:dihydrolipoamide dehydrogenase
MVVGEVASATDVLVIGGGPGGYAAALRVAALGLEVTLVEREKVGGTCLNVGCIPSKALIHAADLAASSEPASLWGIDLEVGVDLARTQEQIGRVVEKLTQGVGSLLDAAGVRVVIGTARFSKPGRVAVVEGEGVRHFEFREAIVATGSRPLELSVLPFSDARVLDSTAALALRELPERMVVVGGGYIGVELGTAFAKLGSEVTLVEALPSLLPLMESRLGRVVERSLGARGVRVLLETRAIGLTDDGLEVEGPRGSATLQCSKIVVAVGRRPNTDDLGFDVAGVHVDDQQRVIVEPSRRAARHVLAIGDITPGPALAHKAMAEAEVAAQTVAGRPAAFDPATIPEVVFSDPEVVSVGLTFDDAEQEGLDPKRGRFPFSASGRAQTLSNSKGEVEIVADRDGTVIGVHLAGPGVSELAGEAALAVEMSATLEDIALTIHPHPTLSESFAEAAWSALGLGLHGGR